MTNIPTSPLRRSHPRFDHFGARADAVHVLAQVSASLGDMTITSLGIESSYAIRVHLGFDDAEAFALSWSAGALETLPFDDGRVHYDWTFYLDRTEVHVYAIRPA